MGSTFGRRFADNPKYFYLYLNQYHRDDIRPIWISKNKKVVSLLRKNSLEAFYLYSLKGIWYALRAKVYLYDNYSKDVCFTLSGGAKKVNLWHGIPLKKIQKDNRFDIVRNPKNRLQRLRWALRRISDEKPSDFILVPSDYLRPIYSSAFNTQNTIICGYPRNDVLISECITNVLTDDEKKTLNLLENIKKDKKIILYMPTFRDSEIDFFNIISIKKLQEFLRDNKIALLVKLHPKSKVYNRFLEVESEHIKVINPDLDPYPILKQVDLLITDYSSIYFDFLHTDKPIIFFSYDLEKYLLESREMYFDYDHMTPGIKVKDQEGLHTAITEALTKDNLYQKEKENIKKLMFNYDTNISCEILYRKIKQICGLV